MLKVTEYHAILRALAKELRKKPLTAKAICEKFGCSKPVAYKRLGDLPKIGVRVKGTKVRESPTGPKSVAYKVEGQA